MMRTSGMSPGAAHPTGPVQMCTPRPSPAPREAWGSSARSAPVDAFPLLSQKNTLSAPGSPLTMLGVVVGVVGQLPRW
jgi:hypothetical protein